MKGHDGLCADCGCLHDHWHEDNPAEWSYRDGCICRLCRESRGEPRLPDGTPLRILADLPVGEWTPVTSHGPSAEWDLLEIDVYVDGSSTFTPYDIQALIDKVHDHYASSEAWFHVSKQSYWIHQYASQGKRYPMPKRRKSTARMSKKWRGRA